MLTPLKAWLWLTLALDTAPAWLVLHHFGTPEKAYFSDADEYALIPRLSEASQKKLADKSLDGAERVLADCDRLGVGIPTLPSGNSPVSFRLAA